mgnify:CR=1 FL=1|jgi:hypothetical protein
MRTCVYDNPATMQRECWQDGHLLHVYSFLVLEPYAKKSIPSEHFFFGANVGPWDESQLIGDANARSPE